MADSVDVEDVGLSHDSVHSLSHDSVQVDSVQVPGHNSHRPATVSWSLESQRLQESQVAEDGQVASAVSAAPETGAVGSDTQAGVAHVNPPELRSTKV